MKKTILILSALMVSWMSDGRAGQGFDCGFAGGYLLRHKSEIQNQQPNKELCTQLQSINVNCCTGEEGSKLKNLAEFLGAESERQTACDNSQFAAGLCFGMIFNG